MPSHSSPISTTSTLTPTSSRISTPTPTPHLKAPHDISSAITEENIILGPRTRKYAKPDTALLAQDPISNDPLTVTEAKSRPDWPEWQKAMDDEMAQLRKLGTFSTTTLPSSRNPIACKWVFRIKRDQLGSIIRYKAHLVAKRFSQIPGIDYDETFAPVVRLDTIRLLLALAARYKLDVHIVDVIGAYLNGKLDEEIYMQQPECYQDGTTMVYKLNKAL
jgi:hypothetical protein